MENNDKVSNQTAGQDNQKCECEGNCCPPKKKTILPKLIFAVILLAAVGIIVVKLFFQQAPQQPDYKQVFRDPNSPIGCDTSRSKTCDTSKGSSCCPK